MKAVQAALLDGVAHALHQLLIIMEIVPGEQHGPQISLVFIR